MKDINTNNNINLINVLKCNSDLMFSGILVTEEKTGRKRKQSIIAITNAQIVMANDSNRNCFARFEFVAPVTFLKPASFPLLVYRAVAMFI